MLSTLKTRFDMYGPIPRLIFDWVVGGDLGGDRRVGRVFDLQRDILSLLGSAGTIFREQENTLILMIPLRHQVEVQVGPSYYIKFATHYIAARVGKAAFGYSNQAMDLYQTLLQFPNARPSAGWIFEGLMHGWLCKGGEFKTKHCESNETEVISLQKAIIFKGLSGLSILLRKEKHSREVNPDIAGVYLQPEIPNFPAADALALLRADTVAWKIILFRMTLNTENEVKASALDKVWGVLPKGIKESCQIYLVWVVREEPQSFPIQKVVGDTGGRWKEKLIQCVLELKDTELQPKFCPILFSLFASL